MDKKAALAALALGAAIGAGGRQAAEGLLTSTASAARSAPFTHAVDLRREYQSAGTPKVTVYGNVKSTPDAGVRDLNQPTSCAPATKTTEACTACMNALAKDCVWP